MARTREKSGRSRSRRTEEGDRRGRRSEELDEPRRDDEFGDEDLDEDDRAGSNDGGSSGGVFAELKNVASDAALAVLAPVAKKAATSAAKYAVQKGPELVEDTLMPMLEDAGGAKGLAGKVMSSDGAGGLLSKLMPGGDEDGGGGAGDGTGEGRRMPVQQAVDVAAPIDVVYDQWTQFEDYPKFMHRVQRVEQEDDAHVKFHAKMWGINRTWEAEIVEQRPDERIVFESVNGTELSGVVTFHELAERLTRIELNIDVEPDGPIEKFARGARFIKRATRGDLKRFKAYVEMHEDSTGEWRGEIDDGEVVAEHDGAEDEYDDEDEPEAEYDDEDEPEAEYDDEDEPEAEAEEEDDDEEEEPSTSRSRSRGSSSKSGTGRGRSRGSASKSKTKSKSGSSSRRSSSRGRSSNGGDPKSSRSGSSSSKRSSSRRGSGSKSRSSSGSSRSRGGSSRSKTSSSRSRSGSSRSKPGSSRSKASSRRSS